MASWSVMPATRSSAWLLRRLRLLQLVLQLAEVRLPVGEALILPAELDELPLDLLFLREDALLDLEHGVATVGELPVDLRPQLHGLLARLDLCLAPDGLRLALGVLDELTVQPPRLADPGRAEGLHGDEREHEPDRDPDGDSDSDQHVPGTSLGWGSHPPGVGPAAAAPPNIALESGAREHANATADGGPIWP